MVGRWFIPSYVVSTYGPTTISIGSRSKINEDWRLGDIALAIKSGPNIHQGSKYVVSEIIDGIGSNDRKPAWGLRFIGVKPPEGTGGWHCEMFRKVPPDAIEEPRRTIVTSTEGVTIP